MSTKVFISYRRDDSAAGAGRVHDRLEREFGHESIFMDVDGISLGVDFVEVVGAEVAKCDVLLAMIGPDWLEARDEEGNRRLDSAQDFVRIEIAAALRRNIPVIPILLDGTRVPKAEHLPDDLDGLARRNGLDVRHASFHADMDKLVLQLRATSRPPPEPPTADPASATPKHDPPSGALGHTGAGSEAKRVAPARAPTPIAAPAILVGIGVVLAATLLGLLYYVDSGRKRAALSPTSGVSQVEPAPSIAPSTNPLLTGPGEPLITGGQEMASSGQPGSEFADCADACPVMTVIPAGKFTMGSPAKEPGRGPDEGPQREVTIAEPFAVAKYEATFAEWDACVAASACPQVKDEWGRGQMPVINVSWDEAKQYVRWLSRKTGKAYRLLTEAEWEYAARAGTKTAYFWGDKVDKGNANCNRCGSQWDYKQAAPVGSFKPNAFGLHDMHGNVWEWVEDSWKATYDGAPRDGSARLEVGDPSERVVRGGSWGGIPLQLRAAYRSRDANDHRGYILGFRVARTLTP